MIGEGCIMPGVKGVALRSMKEPGTAYNDPRFVSLPIYCFCCGLLQYMFLFLLALPFTVTLLAVVPSAPPFSVAPYALASPSSSIIALFLHLFCRRCHSRRIEHTR